MIESKRKALISLLGDEDQLVFEAVRNKLISYGPSVCDWLEDYTLDNDLLARRRIIQILDHFGRLQADTKFYAFCLNHGESIYLEEASWLLAQTVYPQINATAYSALLDDHAHNLMQKIDFGSKPEGIVASINDYLFKSLGYHGNDENYYEAENSYLNRVIDLRTGNPISLCIIYLLVCRRLRLPVTGIGLPGHFLCRFQSPLQELYIDAFNLGRSLTKSDCMKYLKQAGYEYNEAFLMPASPRSILLRICSNLHQIYQQNEEPEQAARLHGYIVALTK